ncbi:unnamed protein product [Gongylonema pulchrum]|uniref:Secreted protein n=1 Tax=Gongylonema pulchrum TaxID=637853 RepID=A0A183DNN3_9BILA|nr:unnamed protein product [Gongylonema pulchrum]
MRARLHRNATIGVQLIRPARLCLLVRKMLELCVSCCPCGVGQQFSGLLALRSPARASLLYVLICGGQPTL